MNMELSTMIDAGVVLIIALAAIIGAVKGIGDTIIKILCIAGGIGLSVAFRDKLAAWLMTTKLSLKLHTRIFDLLRGGGGTGIVKESADESGQSFVESIFSPDTSASPLSKSLGNIFDDAADKAADVAADKLTAISVSAIALALIVLAVCLAAFILRIIIKKGRSSSVVIGFSDRVLGLVLGGVRGLLIAWIAVALLIPVTTLTAPEKTGEMMAALQLTSVARVIYDVNPFLYLIRYIFL